MGASRWEPTHWPDLRSTTAIVTGANSGIGKALARRLASNGATVVMACRSVERAEAARAELEETAVAGEFHFIRCDLADLDSIEYFASEVRAEYDELHLLCNNAGVMAIPYRETIDGFEAQFGINHLGHFALTGRLIDRLIETPGDTRVVTHGSMMHERADTLDLDALRDPVDYDRWAAYAQSKLANVLFALELARRVDRADVELRSVACEPGFVRSNLHVRGPRMEGKRLKTLFWRVATRLFAQAPETGARPMLYGCIGSDVANGEFIRPSGIMGIRGRPVKDTPSDVALDEALAERLWAASVDATGVAYPAPLGSVGVVDPPQRR